MAIDAKIDLMRTLEARLNSVMTAENVGTVTETLAAVLDAYDVQNIAPDQTDSDDLLTCYLDALNVEGRSQKTIDRYRYIIGRVMHAVGVPTRRVTVYNLRAYLASEKAHGKADTTLEGERQILTAYYNWLQRESLIERNPTANLGAIKRAKRERPTFSGADIERMRQCCKCVRDRAIIALLASSGCRVSELTTLNRDSVNTRRMECTVHGKGNKDRTVYIDGAAAMLIEEYLRGRTDDNPALFVGQRGERLEPGGVRCALRDIGKRSGVNHVHPHKFRRTFATLMSRRGMPIQEIASIMGHDKIETTMRYITLNRDDIANDYRKYA